MIDNMDADYKAKCARAIRAIRAEMAAERLKIVKKKLKKKER